MRVLLVCLAVLTTVGCGSNCPQVTTNRLDYSGASTLTVSGAATNEDQSLTMVLSDAFVLADPPAPELGQVVTIGNGGDAPQVDLLGAPTLLLDVLEAKPLTQLDGSELVPGATFDAQGTALVIRWDLPHNADGSAMEEKQSLAFHFAISSYHAPDLPKDLTGDDWTTDPFVTVQFSTDVASTSLGDAQLSGSVSYFLARESVANCPPTPCDQRIFGCS